MDIANQSGEQGIASAGAWDILGMLASTLCILHCVFSPFILPFLTSLNLMATASESVHHALLAVIMSLGMLAFIPGYRKHGRGVIFVIAGFGLASLSFGAFYAEEAFGPTWEMLFTICGGLMLVTTHGLNRSFCNLCPVCKEEACCSGLVS